MATYLELFSISADPELVQRMTIAIAIAAEAIRSEDPGTANHTERMAWAKRALLNPDGMARQILMIALAQNAAFTVEQITGASDTTLQSATNAAIALLM